MKHKHPLQGKTLREQLQEIIGKRDDWIESARIKTQSMEKVRDMADAYDDLIDNLMQAFQEAMLSCLPEKRETEIKERNKPCECIRDKADKRFGLCLTCANDSFINYDKGFNKSIDQMEANIQKLFDKK